MTRNPGGSQTLVPVINVNLWLCTLKKWFEDLLFQDYIKFALFWQSIDFGRSHKCGWDCTNLNQDRSVFLMSKS